MNLTTPCTCGAEPPETLGTTDYGWHVAGCRGCGATVVNVSLEGLQAHWIDRRQRAMARHPFHPIARACNATIIGIFAGVAIVQGKGRHWHLYGPHSTYYLGNLSPYSGTLHDSHRRGLLPWHRGRELRWHQIRTLTNH